MTKTMSDWEKDAAERREKALKEAEATYKKGVAVLKKYIKGLELPEGFTAGWEPDDFGEKDRENFVVKKDGDTELIFRPSYSDGTTRFKAADCWRTFDRRGVDSSFYWRPLWKGDERPPVNDLIKEQLERVAKSRDYFKTAIKVPEIGHTVSPDRLVSLKADLKTKGSISFHPSGFGTGYRLCKVRPRHNYGVKRASADLEKFFEVSPLWIESFDCD